MSKLKVYKASAGSGKTYTLAKEFLMLLFDKKNDHNYRYILAVTFTNKATAEMKTRIINYLYSLTKDPKPEFLPELIAFTGKSAKEVREKARVILTFILNDFSHFNITTIDSFFQKIIRSFAFEAGLPVNFRIELDNDRVLNDAIETIFKELDLKDKKEIRKWIMNQTFSKLQEKGDWKITKEMSLLGREIFKEEFQRMGEEMAEKIANKEFLDGYRKKMKQIVEDFEKRITILSGDILQYLQQCGLTFDDLKGKARSTALNGLPKILAGDKLYEVIPEAVKKLNRIVSEESLCTKTSKRINDITACYNSGLKEKIDNLLAFYSNGREDYFTAVSILPNLSSLGILVDISKMVKEISREENLFLLSDAGRLLNRIIDDNDAPFIYEKTGTRYRHYMIDEFQDTSDLQWSNFRPLILNSISENNKAMVVGDVKQSIYRWRNSDWQLLGKHIFNEFPGHGVDTETLEMNWRSFEMVIEFNNFIFAKSADTLQSVFMDIVADENPDIELSADLSTMITGAYDDVVQKISKNGKDKGGYVEMKFINAGNSEEYELEALPLLRDKIDNLLDAGYEYRDICILVRKRDEGQLVSEYLLGNAGKRYPVISDETLILESSPAVLSVIVALKFINDPDNEILRSYLVMYEKLLKDENAFESESFDAGLLCDDDISDDNGLFDALQELKGKPLFELTETLIRRLPEWIKEAQSPYLRELLNTVQNFINDRSVNLVDFIEWWDDNGRLSAVNIPEGQNAIKIMTVHKSKGLEFKAVIVPFCHWPLDKKSSDSLIWCSPGSAPFNELELVPVGYTDRLINTQFYSQFINERLLQYVDNLNILYVAFTRAREVLMTIGLKKIKKKQEKVEKLVTVSDMLVKSFREGAGMMSETLLTGEHIWHEEEMLFTYGTLPVNSSVEKEEKTIPAPPFKTIPLGSRIKIHADSEAMQSELLEDFRVKGKVMHHLFEKIKTADDVEPAIDALIFEGKILSENREKLTAKIRELLSKSPFDEWFSNKYKILNEASIIQRSGTSRPDRVLIGENKVIVIDYKFGHVKSPKYVKQVKHYMNLIRQMDAGYNNVEGYLWYINKDSTLEKVE